jgi:hypothetical protein
MGGNNYWPQKNRVKPSQHDHASYKGKSDTRWQELGLDTNEHKFKTGKAAFNKIKPALLLNYYSILSDTAPPPCQVKAQETSAKTHINKIRQWVLDSSIPSAKANSGATSNVGTKKDKAKHAYISTGKHSSKIFQLPDWTRTPASNMCLLHHNVCQPARDIHIVPNTPPPTRSLALLNLLKQDT